MSTSCIPGRLIGIKIYARFLRNGNPKGRQLAKSGQSTTYDQPGKGAQQSDEARGAGMPRGTAACGRLSSRSRGGGSDDRCCDSRLAPKAQ